MRFVVNELLPCVRCAQRSSAIDDSVCQVFVLREMLPQSWVVDDADCR